MKLQGNTFQKQKNKTQTEERLFQVSVPLKWAEFALYTVDAAYYRATQSQMSVRVQEFNT